MTMYAGELVHVRLTATDFDGETVTGVDPVTVTATIFNSAGTAVVAETAMDWNAEQARWLYEWESPTTPGTYKVRVRVVDALDRPSIEWHRVRLSKSPVPGE